MFLSYARFYDLFNVHKNYQKEIEFIHQWAENPESIFDIGCGTGNYWSYYPKGTYVLGLDKSQAMANQCSNGVVMCGDIETFKTHVRFDCSTALFDVLNYIPTHEWWKNLPLNKGGYFIFDIWNKDAVDQDGFVKTSRSIEGITRTITPQKYDGKKVELKIDVSDESGLSFSELHTMYVHSHEDIERFCGKEFEIVDTKPTQSWQKWYRLRRK